MTALATELACGRDLVAAPLFDRLVTFLATEEKITRERAERVMDQALAFLHMSAHRNEGLSPSRAVDPGWHAFMLHTREYAAWCQEQFGRFVHHNPFPSPQLFDGAQMRATVAAIEEAGFAVDHELWGTAATCNPPACCGDGGGCGGK
ncbi:glycine-rich domain-containing protein [Streptomyces sp. NPDC015127]|uniref:glycine-rich domain-containing protein n=1 Tax=Streptomyces sp. NPDC015127 TaxID=3364939 RepID=UPI0037000DAA